MKRKPTKSNLKRQASTIGKAPGKAGYVGLKNIKSTDIEIYEYSSERFEVIQTQNVADTFRFKTTDEITWINVNGLNNAETISKLADYYELHSLVLEDIQNTAHRPKIDEYPDYLFIVLKMLYINKAGIFTIEHISLVVGANYVLSFQESEEDLFDFVRERIALKSSRIRNSKSDFLAFALMDTIVDNYFAIVEDLVDRIEYEEELLFTETATEETPKDIQNLKKEILRIRRAVYPAREVLIRLEKIEHPVIDPKNRNYFGDVSDHIVQICENIELYRDMIWGLMDMYMTTMSNKMNNIMKVLTIIATIFIPLTFIAGIYGMNFEFMPELKFKYGYYILWGVMISIFVGLVLFFRKKKWL